MRDDKPTGHGAQHPRAQPPQAAPIPSGDDRALTLSETFEEIYAWRQRIRGTWRERGLATVLVILLGSLVWLLLTRTIPWAGGPIGSVQAVLALDTPWVPIPAPDDPRTASATGLGTAVWVSAPLVIAAFWFTAAYHLDRASRRTYRVSEIPGIRHSTAYTLVAIGAVFPLIILGLVSGAWGLFALIAWTAANQAWGSAVGLAALLGGFAAAVRLGNLILDRHASSR